MKRILPFFAAAVVASTAYGQRMQAEFEDGTTMEYEILSNAATDIAPVYLTLGATHGNVRDGMKIDYYNPDLGVFQLRLPSMLAFAEDNVGIPWRISGLYFLTDETQQKTREVTLMATSSGDVITKYRAEAPIERGVRMGIHGGIGRRNTVSGTFYSDEDTEYTEVSLGLGLFRSQHLSIMREVDGAAYRAQGSASMMLTADAMAFLGTKPTDSTYQGELESSPLGFEVAWVGRASFWGKRDWGIWLTAGYGAGPVSGYPIAGGGLYFGLGNKL